MYFLLLSISTKTKNEKIAGKNHKKETKYKFPEKETIQGEKKIVVKNILANNFPIIFQNNKVKTTKTIAEKNDVINFNLLIQSILSLLNINE